MNHPENVLQKELTIVNALGLHARSAAKIAEMAQNAKHKVWVRYGGETVDAASIIDILTLGAACGSRIEIEIENADDTPVLNAIADLVEAGFGE
ncbi:MAG: HPr family phosphocarrier protein [Desulfobacterales bacterium]|nr:HPr family phosphocarrier protein [Desulfobacterales bacterium]